MPDLSAMADSPPATLRNQIAALRRRRRWLPPLAALGSTFAFIGLAVWILAEHLHVWSGFIAFLLIGAMQYRLVLAAHEATHKTLMPQVGMNEAAGLFCASLVGVSLFNYRRAHLEHHKYPQSIQDDIDGYIYRPLITARPGWPRFLLLFTGNYVDIAIKLRRKFFGDGDLEGTHALVGSKKPATGAVLLQLLPLAGVQLAVFALFTSLVTWWAYPVFWLAPIFIIALQLDRVRTFLEHGYNYFFPGPPIGNLGEAPQTTIDVDTNFIERYLFAPFGFADHQAHHAQLTVPFYNLPELRQIMEQSQPGYVRRIHSSYFTILSRMIRAPVAPEFQGRI